MISYSKKKVQVPDGKYNQKGFHWFLLWAEKKIIINKRSVCTWSHNVRLLIDGYFPLNQILLPPDVFLYKPSTKARNLVWFFISKAICLFANILRFKANINNLTSNFVKNKSNLVIININSIYYGLQQRLPKFRNIFKIFIHHYK